MDRAGYRRGSAGAPEQPSPRLTAARPTRLSSPGTLEGGLSHRAAPPPWRSGSGSGGGGVAAGGSVTARGPRPAAGPGLAEQLAVLSARCDAADARAAREAAHGDALAQRVSRLEGELASALDAAVSAVQQPRGREEEREEAEALRRLRLRVVALETAEAGGGLGGRVEELEGALAGVRDALSVHARASRAGEERSARAAEAASDLQRRLRGLSGRLEACEMGVGAAEASAREALRRAEEGSAPPPPAAGALPLLRLARLEQALSAVREEAERGGAEARAARDAVDALALVTEEFVGRCEALEADVAQALSTVAEQLADEARLQGQ